MARKLSKTASLGLATIIIALLTWISSFFVPEIRALFGREAADNPTNIGITSGDKSHVIQDNKAPVTVNDNDSPKKNDTVKDKPGDKK
jgi:hypothetical protein